MGLSLATKPGVVTLLVVPFEDQTGAVRGPGRLDFVTSVTNAVVTALREAKGEGGRRLFDPFVFSPTSPQTLRALEDGRLTPGVVQGEKDKYACIQIAAALGYETVLFGSISEYEYQERPAQVTLTLSGEAYDVFGNYDPKRGVKAEVTPAANFAVRGTSPFRPHARGQERQLHRLAVKNAAYKVASVMAGKRTKYPSKPKRSKKIGQWLMVAAVIGALAFLVNNNKDEGRPTFVGPAPPRHLRVDRDETSIRLSWDPPIEQAGLALLGYRLERSEGGGPFVVIGGDFVEAGKTTFNDFTVISGEAYTYRIRAHYTSGDFSEFVVFNSIVALEK